ncbi:membrane protein [Asticcacaulis sp. AC460]|uniref:acyltransferase family protein n=1 Tax=Asticcacaulis sp. AC460 TaxID=1282360 RepID=UPI0003C3B7BB|nr:heparan-alpha-glucosaminide N-acetyltransferase domain-containing protein [Asticcacaulis sp. AC460]ESQ86973.1 membrane protein [Asticcacaulis sp. AC460]
MAGQRFTSLDVFRGLTVAFMIVVNTSGPGAEPFAQLSHAKWFGLTLADLVFPAFLFAVGNAMSFGDPKAGTAGVYLWKVVKRAAILFLLGYLMYWFPFVQATADGWALNPVEHTRIPGVLQRIALCFLAAAVAVRWLDIPKLIGLCAVLLLGYWGALLAFGPPGEQFSQLGNIGAQIDRAVIGIDHMYAKGKGYDPEGLFSTLPAIVNVLAGYLAGRYIRSQSDLRPDLRQVAIRLAIAGAVIIAAALAWSLAFPLSKRLWTSSFALINIGIDLGLLAGLIAYVELAKLRFGVRFCEVFGRNPLAIYLFSELLVTVLQLIRLPSGKGLYDVAGALFQAVVPGALGALLCAIAYMLVCWGFGYALDRNRILIKI